MKLTSEISAKGLGGVILRYDLGKCWSGYFKMKEFRSCLKGTGLSVNRSRNILPENGWDYAGELPIPGTLGGAFFTGYYIYIYGYNSEKENEEYTRKLKDICDLL